METLSVGVLIDVVYPFTHGGAEKRYALLTHELAERGHEVTVYTMKWWDGPTCPTDNGVRHVAVAEPSRLYADGARRSLLQPARFALSALQSLHGRHDLVDCNQFPFVHLPAARVAAAMRSQAFLVTWHEVWRSYWLEYAPFPAGLMGMALEDLAPHLAATNIAVSHHTARRLRTLGARPDRIEVVPNAVDLARIDAVPARDEPTDVVFVGRLIAHKRVDRLIAAIAQLRERLPEVRCTIVGSGPEEQRLRALAAGMGVQDNVEFTGALEDEDDVLATLKAAKLFVSASEREGFGIAALEAMACRLPVASVAAPLNALADELVQDGRNGRVVVEPRARALAAAMAGVLEDERGRRRMAEAARLTALDYDRVRVGDRLEQVYRAALGQEPVASAPAEPRRALAALAR